MQTAQKEALFRFLNSGRQYKLRNDRVGLPEVFNLTEGRERDPVDEIEKRNNRGRIFRKELD